MKNKLTEEHKEKIRASNLATKALTKIPTDVRFWRKVNKTKSCWMWMGAKNENGYGLFYFGSSRNSMRCHRYAYERRYGKIPEGLTIDHLCKVTSCVNPEHLEAVTAGVNTLRGNGISAINKAKKYCKRGHKFLEGSFYVHKTGGRQCKECTKIRNRKVKESIIQESNK